MVLEVAIHHWGTVVAGEDTGTEGFGRLVQKLADLLYLDDCLLTSLVLVGLQEALGVLMGLFERFGLHTNMDKMVGIPCQPYMTVGSHLKEAYIRRVIWEGFTYW